LAGFDKPNLASSWHRIACLKTGLFHTPRTLQRTTVAAFGLFAQLAKLF